MKYPAFWKKVVDSLAFLSGCMVMLTAILSTYEAIARFFKTPTSWSLNFSTYILIWAMFLGASYAFQEHGHVAVDMLRDVADKISGRKNRLLRRCMAVIGYLMAVVFSAVLLYGGRFRVSRAMRLNAVTPNTTPIPLWILDAAIVAGSLLMLVTLVFILLDLLNKGEKYL